ncbi:MAG: hypothetical protein V4547_06065 [Bacteroidota bacterium]
MTIKATERPFEIRLTNVGEIRMGSPYNLCSIQLIGRHRIKIPQNGWQDIYAWSEDSKKLVLIKWDFENNDPGFHLFVIDTENGKTLESPRIFGLPKNVSIAGDTVTFIKFLYNKTKEPTDCFYKEKYQFYF